MCVNWECCQVQRSGLILRENHIALCMCVFVHMHVQVSMLAFLKANAHILCMQLTYFILPKVCVVLVGINFPIVQAAHDLDYIEQCALKTQI